MYRTARLTGLALRHLTFEHPPGFRLAIPRVPHRPARPLIATKHFSATPSISSSPSSGTTKATPVEGAEDISHSTFISSASPSDDFNPLQTPTVGAESHDSHTTGHLSPTNSHLFKLILPLPLSLHSKSTDTRPTAFLLHPSQPLSHLSRLIAGSLPPLERNADIEYLALTGQESDLDSHLRAADAAENDSASPGAAHGVSGRDEGGPYLGERQKGKGRWQEVSWSQSTDLSDFIKQSCLNERFKIIIKPEVRESRDGSAGKGETGEKVIQVVIPSFASRTSYLRNRLLKLTRELERVTKQKKSIDLAAHKSAQRLGTAALTAGGVYWGAVVYYTFFTESGWDLMEPFTWTIGYAALLGGCSFLVYHNREVSYSSLLDLSVTARQRSLYDKHGLDIEHWTEMVSEAKTLRREIARIAKDYDIEWKGELENLAAYTHPTALPRSDIPAKSSDSPSQRSEAKQGDEGEGQDDGGGAIDIDKTIDEAAEMAEQTKEKQQKAKDAERKGEVVDERREMAKAESREDDDGDEGESVEKGETRARKAALGR